MSDCPCDGKCPDCACQQIEALKNLGTLYGFEVEHTEVKDGFINATVKLKHSPKYVHLSFVVPEEE